MLRKIDYVLFFIVCNIFTWVHFVQAQEVSGPGGGNITGPGGSGGISGPGGSLNLDARKFGFNGELSFMTFVDQILEISIQVGTIVLAVMIVYTGFLFVTAQGNEEKLTQARNSLTYVLIGGAIILSAVTLSAVITNTIGSLQT
jgi:hypothetical protein